MISPACRAAWFTAPTVVALLAVSGVGCLEEGGSSGAEPAAASDAGPVDLNQGTKSDRSRDGAGGREPDEWEADVSSGPVRFASEVVSFAPGTCAGFGATDMPSIVLGPPRGAGDEQGSLDVVSLGGGGEIVLSFEPYAIVDRPGVDFIVFENPFYAGGQGGAAYAELGEVSVSEDGLIWTRFPCDTAASAYGECAGWHPVYASGPSFDPAEAGGDAFDLSSIGVERARFVRIRDRTSQRCTSLGPNTNGFDLDAIAVIHSEP
jgi:hypothetical protein